MDSLCFPTTTLLLSNTTFEIHGKGISVSSCHHHIYQMPPPSLTVTTNLVIHAQKVVQKLSLHHRMKSYRDSREYINASENVIMFATKKSHRGYVPLSSIPNPKTARQPFVLNSLESRHPFPIDSSLHF